MTDTRLAILVSGSGTILQAMIDVNISIRVVVADRPCRALDIAMDHGVEAVLVDRKQFGGFTTSFDREGFSKSLADVLVARQIDLIAMAGFGTIVTSALHDEFHQRILNTHPSLLPKFKGWHAVRDALQAGATQTGCTVHMADLELDHGPILAQQSVEILAEDTEDSLHERIKSKERELYPRVVIAALEAIGRGQNLTDVRLDD